MKGKLREHIRKLVSESLNNGYAWTDEEKNNLRPAIAYQDSIKNFRVVIVDDNNEVQAMGKVVGNPQNLTNQEIKNVCEHAQSLIHDLFEGTQDSEDYRNFSHIQHLACPI